MKSQSELKYETYHQCLLLEEETAEILATRRDLSRRQRRLAKKLTRDLRDFCADIETPGFYERHALSSI